MANFSIDPKFSAQLDWMREFVAKEIEPIDLAFAGEEIMYDKAHPMHHEVLAPLQQQVRDQNLWSCHLTPEYGGQGYGQVKLAYMNEILGRTSFGPMVFGCQAPDSGNAEIIAHYGTDAQKAEFLEPLLDGRLTSSYSMTEPQAGSDPAMFTTRAVRDGDEWIIDGTKFFSSSLDRAAFVVLMAVTDPDVSVYQGTSMFLVPRHSPGIEILRHTGVGYDPEGEGNHPLVQYTDVRVPAANMLGDEGQAFVIAQTRLGGGRLHHAMRTVGAVARCFDMICERVLSRTTKGELLAQKQMVQDQIADAWIELQQFRLQVLHASWVVDQVGGKAARKEIAGVKIATPKVYQAAVLRAIHLHGALGTSNEMPLARMLMASVTMGIADGPTEVHKMTLARQLLKGYSASDGLWPSEHLPDRRSAARAQFADILDRAAAEH